MQFGSAVVFNGGEGQEHLLAFVRSGTGDKTDLVVLRPDGIAYENDVPRRDPDDYGPEGGGRTWHPVA